MPESGALNGLCSPIAVQISLLSWQDRSTDGNYLSCTSSNQAVLTSADRFCISSAILSPFVGWQEGKLCLKNPVEFMRKYVLIGRSFRLPFVYLCPTECPEEIA